MASNINATRIGPGLQPGLRGERTTPNRFIHNSAPTLCSLVQIWPHLEKCSLPHGRVAELPPKHLQICTRLQDGLLVLQKERKSNVISSYDNNLADEESQVF